MIPALDLQPELEEIRDEINEAITRVIDQTSFVFGPDVTGFEKEAAEWLGARYAVGVNSGTDALVISMRSLGIGAGDEVITTPFSFFATAESISNTGARPVFVDIEAGSFNIDPDKIEAAITPKTRAILPVHLFGRPADMDRILAIAEKHGLSVIEDCAQSFGAQYHGDNAGQTGTIGDLGAFSFFPTKNLGGFGDGGLIVTDDEAAAEKARMLRTHGSIKKYQNELLGYNSRLDSLQAAVLRVKLPHIGRWNEGRRSAAMRYNNLFKDNGRVPSGTIVTPEVTPGHVFHQYTLRLRNVDRDRVQAALKEAGIGVMVYYPVPLDRMPVYRGSYPRNPLSDEAADQVISLPIWPSISPETQQQVADGLFDALNQR